MSLTDKKCVPCEVGTPPLTGDEIKKHLKELALEWEIIDGKKISHQFTFKNFVIAMKFVNNISAIAEEEGHHPDIHIYYNKVRIDLWTHATGGLSENDFIVASKIEKITQ